MPKLTSLEDLRRLKEEAQREIKVRADTGTKITVGHGHLRDRVGSREVMHAILRGVGATTSRPTWPRWAASDCARRSRWWT